MRQLGLNLITGPANAGKVALLLRRYLQALDAEPYLIVPNRSDVERVERDLLELQPALFAGSIGTFDDLFSRIARAGADVRSVATDAQRALLVRRALASHSLNGLGRSARFGGVAGGAVTSGGVGALRRVRGCTAHDGRGARVRSPRPQRPRRRTGRALRRLPRGARPAQPL